jgi:transcriptional regulator with XRE-family HTH domain
MTKLRKAWDKKASRKTRPLTQKGFCNEMDLDPQRFNRILSGKERPRLKYAMALKKKLGISLDIIYDGYDYEKYITDAETD